jgi:hypothetical protein
MKLQKKMKPTPDIKKITQKLRCLLTDDDKINAGKELAEATEELTSLSEDKSQVMADFKAKMAIQEAQISSLSSKLRSGYEFRNVECEIHFDKPEAGHKQIIRLDTGEVVLTEPLTEEEKQRRLALE